jgi:hypothetical protein
MSSLHPALTIGAFPEHSASNVFIDPVPKT